MAKESINIRIARDDDYKFFKKIEESALELFLEHGCDLSNLETLSEDDYKSITGQHVIYVAYTDQNKIVGFCAVKIVDDNAYVMELSVLSGYRQRGIGRSLMHHACYWAETNNFEYITLTTFKFLPFNAPYYKKLSFKEFTIDAKWPKLKRIREQEKKMGLDILPRTVMRKSLRDNQQT